MLKDPLHRSGSLRSSIHSIIDPLTVPRRRWTSGSSNRTISHFSFYYGPRTIKYEKFSDALNAVGPFGKYQIFACVVMQYATLLWVGNFDAFLEVVGSPSSYDCGNRSVSIKPSQFCHNITQRENCTLNTMRFRSLIDEWDLNCDRYQYFIYILVAQCIGRLAGSIVGGHTADNFGRQSTMYVAQMGICLSSTLSIASQTPQTFAVFSVLTGFFYGAVASASIALVLECTAPEYVMLANAAFQWTLAYPASTLIAFLTQNWRLYLVIINFLTSPLLIFYLLFLESPRWLIQAGNHRRAAETLEDIAHPRWNNRNLDIIPEHLDKIPATRSKFYTAVDLFRYKNTAILSISLIFLTISFSFARNAFLVDAQNLLGSDDIYTQLAYYGLAQIPFVVIFAWLDWKVPSFGRRSMFLVSQVTVTAAFTVVLILLILDQQDHVATSLFAVIGVAIVNSGVRMSITQVTFDYYPTVVRCIALGTLYTNSGFGVYVSLALKNYYDVSIWGPGPYIAALSLSICALVLGYLVIPETKFDDLCDLLEDLKPPESDEMNHVSQRVRISSIVAS